MTKGLSARAAARRFKVSVNSAIRWLERFEVTGGIEPVQRPEKHDSPLNEKKDWLLELVRLEPDLTLQEIAERLAVRGVKVGPSGVWRFFDRNGVSFKKTSRRR